MCKDNLVVMMDIVRIVILFLQFVLVARTDEVSCTESYCQKYLLLNKCPSIPEQCQIQNATYNGIELPFPGPCDCCKYCLTNLKEDEDCSVGSSSTTLSTNICSDRLACDSTTKKCKRINTICTNKQDDFDRRNKQGELGYMETRAVCDGDGKYKPYKCVPNEICYCVDDEEERRIYGEIPFTKYPDLQMKCGCSRYYENALKITNQELYPKNRFRCMPDGSFDELQCIDGLCFCVDKINGEPNSLTDIVNITLISEDKLPCFDKKIHVPNYYYECEQLVIEKLLEIENYINDGYEPIGFTFPSCNIDGKYGPIQSNETHKYCSDSSGKIIEYFAIELESPIANIMNCACAKARTLIKSAEKPTCMQNGNYEYIQCRRGKCRCVDSNGNQIQIEVPYKDKDTLRCPR